MFGGGVHALYLGADGGVDLAAEDYLVDVRVADAHLALVGLALEEARRWGPCR